VHISDEASADIVREILHVHRDSPRAAAELENRFYEAIESLEYFPERGAFAPESDQWGYVVRFLLVFQFRVLYTVRGADVVALRIVHGSRLGPIEPNE
jgi:plasmid stabilization system protein ParE